MDLLPPPSMGQLVRNIGRLNYVKDIQQKLTSEPFGHNPVRKGLLPFSRPQAITLSHAGCFLPRVHNSPSSLPYRPLLPLSFMLLSLNPDTRSIYNTFFSVCAVARRTMLMFLLLYIHNQSSTFSLLARNAHGGELFFVLLLLLLVYDQRAKLKRTN